MKKTCIFLSFLCLFVLAQKNILRYDPLELHLIGATHDELEVTIETSDCNKFNGWEVVKAKIPKNSQLPFVQIDLPFRKITSFKVSLLPKTQNNFSIKQILLINKKTQRQTVFDFSNNNKYEIPQFFQNNERPFFFFLLSILSSCFIIYFFLFVQRNVLFSIHFVFLFAFAVLFWTLWLAAFWPGWFTNDSISTLNEIARLQFDNWHPFVYALYVMFFKQFGSIGFVPISQVLLTAFIIAYIFDWCIRQGINKKVAYGIFFVFVLLPPIPVFNLMIWKDVPFSLAILYFSACVFFGKNDKENGGKGLCLHWIYIPLVFVLMTLLIFSRHNGIIYILAAPIFGYFCISKKTYPCFLACFLSVLLLFKIVVPSVMGISEVKTSSLFLTRSVLSIMTSPSFFSETYLEDIKKVEEAMQLPWDYIKEKYPTNFFEEVWDKSETMRRQFDKSNGETAEFNRQFLIKKVLDNIPIFMGTRTWELFHAMGPDSPHSDQRNKFYYNPFQLAGSMLSPPGLVKWGVVISCPDHFPFLRKKLQAYVDWSYRYNGLLSPSFWIWSLSPWLLISLLIVLKEGIGRSISMFFMVSWCSVMMMFLLGPSESWRYFYYVYLQAMVTIPLYLAYLKTKKNQTTGPIQKSSPSKE